MLVIILLLACILGLQFLRFQRVQTECNLLRYWINDLDADLATLEGRVDQMRSHSEETP